MLYSFNSGLSTVGGVGGIKEMCIRDSVCVPRTYPQGRMEFVEYDPDILEKTRFGLLEPCLLYTSNQ